MAEPTLIQLVEAYIKLRDRKKVLDDEHKARIKPINDFMETLEGKLLAGLDATGAQSLAGGAGTVYKRIETSLTVEDAVKFEEWALDHWDMLDVKPNKTSVQEMLARNEAPPPGVKITQIACVGVQRK